MNVRMKSAVYFQLTCCAFFFLTLTACRVSPPAKEAKYMRRGQAEIGKKDFTRAVLEFRNAAHAMPKDPEPLYQLGLAYLASGDVASSVTALQQAIGLNPKHWGAQLKLAELMTASRNKQLTEQAATELQEILAASPNNMEAIDTLAITEVELGKPEDAALRLGAGSPKSAYPPAVFGCSGAD